MSYVVPWLITNGLIFRSHDDELVFHQWKISSGIITIIYPNKSHEIPWKSIDFPIDSWLNPVSWTQFLNRWWKTSTPHGGCNCPAPGPELVASRSGGGDENPLVNIRHTKNIKKTWKISFFYIFLLGKFTTSMIIDWLIFKFANC